MARAIGLDIGARTIKVVELAGSAKSPKIQQLGFREIPPPPPPDQQDEDYDPDQATVDQVNQLFKELKLPKDDVSAAFDSGVTVFREITVPFFEDDQIRKIVKFEAENHLHSYSIDDVVVNWVKTGETRDGSRLTIFASPKVDLARRIAILRRAGIEPASIDLDTTALFSALDATGTFEEHPNVIVIDVGAHSTSLIHVASGKPRVLRSFLLGAAGLEADISSDLDTSREEGRRRVLAQGEGGGDDLFVAASDLETAPEDEKSLARIEADVVVERRSGFVKKLHREAVRSLSSVRNDEPPDRILLLGGGSLIPGVDEALAERFELPVERYDFLAHVETKDSGPDPAFAGAALGPAIGCGLRMLGKRGLGIELLQDEFAPSNTFDVIKGALCVAVTLGFLALFAATMVERERLSAEKAAYNNWSWVAKQMFLKVEPAYLNRVEDKAYDTSGGGRGEAMELAKRWIASLPNDSKQVQAIRSRLRRRHQLLQTRLGLARNIPKLPSALECMVEVYKALSSKPREELGKWFQIQNMNIGIRRMSMKVVISDSVVQDTVERLLLGSEYLQGRAKSPTRFVEVGTAQRLPNGRTRVEFTIRFKDE